MLCVYTRTALSQIIRGKGRGGEKWQNHSEIDWTTAGEALVRSVNNETAFGQFCYAMSTGIPV